MSITGFVILIVLVLILILIYVELGGLPGKTARKRGHPQAEAINVLGWLGLLMGIVPWLIALVWAYTKNPDAAPAQENASDAEDTPA
jgi:hypothetical protein